MMLAGYLRILLSLPNHFAQNTTEMAARPVYLANLIVCKYNNIANTQNDLFSIKTKETTYYFLLLLTKKAT